MPDNQTLTDITPETTVAVLLAARPEMTAPLAALSRTLAEIENRDVYDAIARVTTLRRLAERDGTDPAAFVAKLRVVAGLPEAGNEMPAGAPAWFDASRIAASLDARAEIAAGSHPAQKVIATLRALPEGGIFELVTAFVPVPLIEMARMNGFDGWARRDGDQLVRTYFNKA